MACQNTLDRSFLAKNADKTRSKLNYFINTHPKVYLQPVKLLAYRGKMASDGVLTGENLPNLHQKLLHLQKGRAHIDKLENERSVVTSDGYNIRWISEKKNNRTAVVSASSICANLVNHNNGSKLSNTASRQNIFSRNVSLSNINPRSADSPRKGGVGDILNDTRSVHWKKLSTIMKANLAFSSKGRNGKQQKSNNHRHLRSRRRDPMLITEKGRRDTTFHERECGNNILERDEDPLLKFRRVAKTIVVLLKATSTRQEQIRSEEKQVNLASYQDEILNSRRSNYGTDLSFDPMEFRAQRQVALSTEAKTILSLHPKSRTEEQIRVALLSLQNTLDAFCEFPIKMQTSLVRRGWFEHFEAKRVIIRQGHKADNYYMIICGKTVVTIMTQDEKTGESKTITAAILGKGKSFGELAIMHGATRSATVTCQTDVELLALHRDDFIDIFMHIEKNREPEHISYLRGIEILNLWPIEKLPWNDPNICLFMFFRRGTIMCKDSNHSDWIYVIKSGSCRVLKSLIATKPDITGLAESEYDDVSSSTNSSLFRLTPRSIQPTKSQHSGSTPSLISNSTNTHHKMYSNLSSRSKQNSNFLPPIKSVTEPHHQDHQSEELVEQHKRKLDDIYQEIQYMRSRKGKKQDAKSNISEGDKVFVQLQKLGPKDTLGLEPIAFDMMDSYTSVSLVSEGVEAIMINKKFFTNNITEEYQRHLRRTLRPYPSDTNLQQKLQDETNWNAFKTMTVNKFVYFHKFSQETLSN